jgi:hypothetical protein
MSGTGFRQLQPPVFQRDQIAGTFRNLRGHDAVVEREAGAVFGNGDRFFRAQQGCGRADHRAKNGEFQEQGTQAGSGHRVLDAQHPAKVTERQAQDGTGQMRRHRHEWQLLRHGGIHHPG